MIGNITLVASDFTIRQMKCPKCGRPANVYELKATDDNFLICRWGNCAVGTMEGNYACIWRSLTDEQKKRVLELRADATEGGAK